MAGMSDYLENKMVDFLFRGQSLSNPVVYVALYTAAPSDAGGGTEVSGGSYARVKAAAGAGQALTDWAGTQSAGSTTASSGTGGQTSNNNVITFPAPTGNWGSITHFGLFDAISSGNLLFWAPLTTAKTVNSGDSAPSFAAGALTVTLD